MRLLIDTNRLTDLFRNDKVIARILEQASEIWLPFIVLAELKGGFLVGSKPLENESLLNGFLRLPGVGILYADRETIEIYARLYMQLRRAGQPIPTNDLWIASLAVQHQLTLASRDEHFDKLPQVLRV